MPRPSNQSSRSSALEKLLVDVERLHQRAEEFQKKVEGELRQAIEELSVRQARRR